MLPAFGEQVAYWKALHLASAGHITTISGRMRSASSCCTIRSRSYEALPHPKEHLQAPEMSDSSRLPVETQDVLVKRELRRTERYVLVDSDRHLAAQHRERVKQWRTS